MARSRRAAGPWPEAAASSRAWASSGVYTRGSRRRSRGVARRAAGLAASQPSRTA